MLITNDLIKLVGVEMNFDSAEVMANWPFGGLAGPPRPTQQLLLINQTALDTTIFCFVFLRKPTQYISVGRT